MILEARVGSSFLGLKKKVEVSAFCTRSEADVKEPEIGCGQCHLDLPAFNSSSEDL
jgi:hypothetical protein